VSRHTYLVSPQFLLKFAYEPLLIRNFPLKESILTHWTFLTTYEAVVAALLCRRFAGHLLRIWAVVNSTWQKRPGYEFTTHTSSTVQQSTPVSNKSDSLKAVMVDVLFGVPEVRTGKQSNKVRPMRYPRVCYTV
jgi:hypothetical protein